MLEDLTSRPYLIRAVYDWCADQRNTPYLLAEWRKDNPSPVPSALVSNGKIVLNLSPDAVRHLVIDEHGVQFTARFLGRAVEVHVPLPDILSIYSREKQTGISFPPLPPAASASPPAASPSPPSSPQPAAKKSSASARKPARKKFTERDLKII